MGGRLSWKIADDDIGIGNHRRDFHGAARVEIDKSPERFGFGDDDSVPITDESIFPGRANAFPIVDPSQDSQSVAFGCRGQVFDRVTPGKPVPAQFEVPGGGPSVGGRMRNRRFIHPAEIAHVVGMAVLVDVRR